MWGVVLGGIGALNWGATPMSATALGCTLLIRWPLASFVASVLARRGFFVTGRRAWRWRLFAPRAALAIRWGAHSFWDWERWEHFPFLEMAGKQLVFPHVRNRIRHQIGFFLFGAPTDVVPTTRYAIKHISPKMGII